MYDISFNDVRASFIGILPVRRPSVPAPEPRFEEITIPGRDGSLISIDGVNGETVYNSITISVEFNFWAKPYRWAEVFRAAKKWIKGSGSLILGDDTSFFYKVLSCKISDSERTSLRIGTFTAEFLCDPYMYVNDGQREMSIGDVLYNSYALSKPTYVIMGEGMCTLTVNGKSVTANVGQNLTINTDLMLAYRKDGTMMNTSVTGDYEDLWLNPGENSITTTSGFSLVVIPNWRCL